MDQALVVRQEQFGDLRLNVVEYQRQEWFVGEDIGKALGYKDNWRKSIGKIWERNKEEFEGISSVVNLTTEGEKKFTRRVRIFNLQAVQKLAFLARTPRAKELRLWASRKLAQGIYKMQDRILELEAALVRLPAQPGPVERWTFEDFYRARNNHFKAFLEECMEVAPGAFSLSGEIYLSYCHWAGQRKMEPCSQRALGIFLGEIGLIKRKSGKGCRGWLGVEIKSGARPKLLPGDSNEGRQKMRPGIKKEPRKEGEMSRVIERMMDEIEDLKEENRQLRNYKPKQICYSPRVQDALIRYGD